MQIARNAENWNENQTLRVIFVGWLLVLDHVISPTDRIGDRGSPYIAESSSSETSQRRILCN